MECQNLWIKKYRHAITVRSHQFTFEEIGDETAELSNKHLAFAGCHDYVERQLECPDGLRLIHINIQQYRLN